VFLKFTSQNLKVSHVIRPCSQIPIHLILQIFRCTKLENCAVNVVQLPKVDDPEKFTSDKLSSGQASKPYSKTGIHLVYISCKVVFTEAIRPTLPNIALADRQKDRFA